MRPLVLAAALTALAGCSIPYQGTSFAALPKPERMAEGQERKTNDEKPAGGERGAAEVGIGSEANVASAEGEGAPTNAGMDEGSTRTGAVFPMTAQPSSKRLLVQEGYRGDGTPERGNRVDGE